MPVVANGIVFNTDSGLAVPGGLLDQLTNPDTQLKQQQADFGRLRMGILSQSLQDQATFDNPSGRAGPSSAVIAPASAVASTPPSTKGANPDVVEYFRSRAPAFGINPNAALSVASKEGLFGFDPAGKPNPGDNNSSFGPLQLHYGGVASGGNAAPGLGDDFTKATGLDARDPSTWKAQIDFALAHAAKHGWGAWHGAINAGIGEWAGIDRSGEGAPQPQPAASALPTRVAQNGATDAPTSVHPYAAPAASGQPAAAVPQQSGSPQGGPDLLNLPPAYRDPGGGTRYVNDILSKASQYALNGDPRAALWQKKAEQVQAQLDQAQKARDASSLAVTRANARVGAEYSPQAIRGAGQKAQATASGTAEGGAPYKLIPVQPVAGGPTVMVPESQAIASPTPMVSKQPPVINQQQEALGKQISSVPDMLRQRQITRERIDAMTNLLETFQSGAGADQKAAAVAAVRAAGVPIKDTDTANPAAVEQFWKNAQANVFSQIKDQGGKVLVSEIQGFQKANANPNMQPESNAAILAQQKGLLDWQDAHDRALIDWYHKNPYAYDASNFEMQWERANKPTDYVAAARKEIAPRGAAIPAPAQRVVGQRYAVPGKGVYRWAGNGWSAQ